MITSTEARQIAQADALDTATDQQLTEAYRVLTAERDEARQIIARCDAGEDVSLEAVRAAATSDARIYAENVAGELRDRGLLAGM